MPSRSWTAIFEVIFSWSEVVLSRLALGYRLDPVDFETIPELGFDTDKANFSTSTYSRIQSRLIINAQVSPAVPCPVITQCNVEASPWSAFHSRTAFHATCNTSLYVFSFLCLRLIFQRLKTFPLWPFYLWSWSYVARSIGRLTTFSERALYKCTFGNYDFKKVNQLWDQWSGWPIRVSRKNKYVPVSSIY